MVAIVTYNGQKHIYDVYGCLQCENNRVLLRISHCYWDIIIYDVPASIIDFYISQIERMACFDFSEYNCRIIDHSQTHNEPSEDDYERERYYQEQHGFER